MRVFTDQDVYKYFLGDIVIGNMYNSPIPIQYRPKDSTPSFAIYEKDNILKWVDHGLTAQYGNKVENLVQYLRHLPLDGKGFFMAKDIINKEVKVGMMGTPLTQLRSRPKHDQPPFIKTGPLRQFEYDFWDRFDVDPVTDLHKENIEALYSMGFTLDGSPVIQSTPEDPAFVYWWSKNPASYKIYRPLTKNKRDKFRQYNVDKVIEGWNSLLEEFNSLNGNLFDIVFVTSSTKDRLVVKKAFGPNCSAINPRGEKDRIDIIERKDEIKSMAKRVICLYDADDPGYEGSKVLSELTGFEYYDTRERLLGHKDFADMKDRTKGNLPYSVIKNTINNLIY